MKALRIYLVNLISRYFVQVVLNLNVALDIASVTKNLNV